MSSPVSGEVEAGEVEAVAIVEITSARAHTLKRAREHNMRTYKHTQTRSKAIGAPIFPELIATMERRLRQVEMETTLLQQFRAQDILDQAYNLF
jgi:hypothetical protein